MLYVYAYIDDVLIASSTPAEHLEHLCAVFECLITNDIVVNPSKCVFTVKDLDFLEHHIGHQGINPL